MYVQGQAHIVCKPICSLWLNRCKFCFQSSPVASIDHGGLAPAWHVCDEKKNGCLAFREVGR